MSHLRDTKKRRLPELTERLRRKFRRITAPREAILDALRRHQRPLTIKEIRSDLRRSDCDLATIYRSMHLLEETGMVKKFDFGTGAARFELLDEGDDGHHHHLVCTRCSDVVELDECFPKQLEQRIADKNGFKAVTHKLEFFGLCPRCQ